MLSELHAAASTPPRWPWGERGPVWWTDGAPDYNRHMARNTPYRKWYESIVENS
jgi:hypothetical protein